MLARSFHLQIIEVGDGHPCSSRDACFVEVWEITGVPENSHMGIEASSQPKMVGTTAQVHLHHCTKDGQRRGGAGSCGAAGKLLGRARKRRGGGVAL